MGLDVEVGYLADLLGNDEEGAEGFREGFAYGGESWHHAPRWAGLIALLDKSERVPFKLSLRR